MTDTLNRAPLADSQEWQERGVTIVKLNPAGREVARYSAEWLEEALPETWICVQATWTMNRVDAGGLVFETGDTLFEYFSTEYWFNAFRVVAPDGTVRGIYGNVTYPTSVDLQSDEVVITWHDLYLDVLRFPDGTVALCDVNELAASGLLESDPNLHGLIRRTADEMMTLAGAGAFPFHGI